jgi:hypothetical protein
MQAVMQHVSLVIASQRGETGWHDEEEEEEFTQKHYQKGLQKSTHTTTDYPYDEEEEEFTRSFH